MLEALQKNLGIVTRAAEMSGCSREQHYAWMKKDAKYRKAVEELAEVAVDFAEASLFAQIRKQEAAATIFFLKTKARHRGYIERKEMDVTSKGEHIAKPPVTWTDDEENPDA
ncbi:MAG: hypothetical protein KIS74_02995 [Burkholderiales bacterium]|nr:hypothetical protein [Burkholderiales bacterium]